MSDFWTLWNAAEKGDRDAAHQVNVLVAKRAGYDARLTKTPMYSKTNGELTHVMERWSVYAPDGKRLGMHERATEHEAWNDAPDYMGDFEDAKSFDLPDGCFMQITSPCGDESLYAVEVYRYVDMSMIAFCASQHELYARVGATWVAVTGEKQPERSE